MGKLDSGSEALATVYIQTEGLHSYVLHRVSVECGQYEYGQHGQYGHWVIMVNMITMVIMVRR